MTVYKILTDKENFRIFNLDLEELFSELGEDFDFNFPSMGVYVKDSWKTLKKGEFIQTPEYPDAIETPDISEWQSGDLVLSDKAFSLLHKYLSDYGEFLPVQCNNDNYYIFNILNIMNVVDMNDSEQDIDQGIYMGINKLSFKEDLLADTLIFKTKFDNLTGVYCTDTFRDLIDELGLTGLLFTDDLTSS